MNTENSIFDTAVIISVYRGDSLSQLQECMDSIFSQSFKNYHIYVQKDGVVSSDVGEYLDNLKSRGFIHYLGSRQQNRGLAFSLNELLELVLDAKYLYIARMDADDICCSNRLEMQRSFLFNNEEIHVCGGEIEEFNEDSKERVVVSYKACHSDILKELRVRNPVAHVTVMIRRSFFEKVGLYNSERLNEDLDLWIRGFKCGAKFHNLDEVLVKVRTSNAFYTRRANWRRALEVMKLKLHATKTFKFGASGYFFAVAHFFLFMSPGWLKIFLYKRLRGNRA